MLCHPLTMAKPELTSLLRQALDVLDKEKASSNDGEASSSTNTFPSSILPTPNVFGLNATPTRAHHAVQGDSYTQFRFSDEKDWEMDSLAKNQIPALFVDLTALTQSLEELPLHTRLNLEAELVQVTPFQLPSVTAPHKTDITLAGGLKAPQVSRDSGLAVKSGPGLTPSSPLVSTAVEPPTDDDDDDDDDDMELDLLLNLTKPVTQLASSEFKTIIDETPNNPVTAALEEKKEKIADANGTKPEVKEESKSTRRELTEEDLEDWLDSIIS